MRSLGRALPWLLAAWLVVARSSAQDSGGPEAIASAGKVPDSSAATNDLLMSESELAALGLDQSNPAFDSDLKLSGFADVGFGMLFAPDNSYWRAAGVLSPQPAFYVGNANIYLFKQLTATLRSMAEVRFSFLPNGSTNFGFDEPQNTTAFDYSDYGRQTRWGSIIIQRIYVEWSPHSLFTIRMGEFLTPYGVWNVDHGSPVFIPVRRPWSMGMAWIPEHQTGLELYGYTEVSSFSAVGYHLTLSNGTGPISEYADLDKNKAIGARLFWEYSGWGRFRLGASAYYGRETDSRYSPMGAPGSGYTSRETIASQFDALSWAGDLTWDLGGLHVQGEWIVNQRNYTAKGRVAVNSLGATIVPRDAISWGGYGLVGYRFSFLGIMPFVLVERVWGVLSYRALRVYSVEGGLNVRPADALVVKLSFVHAISQTTELPAINALLSQVAWAF